MCTLESRNFETIASLNLWLFRCIVTALWLGCWSLHQLGCLQCCDDHGNFGHHAHIYVDIGLLWQLCIYSCALAIIVSILQSEGWMWCDKNFILIIQLDSGKVVARNRICMNWIHLEWYCAREAWIEAWIECREACFGYWNLCNRHFTDHGDCITMLVHVCMENFENWILCRLWFELTSWTWLVLCKRSVCFRWFRIISWTFELFWNWEDEFPSWEEFILYQPFEERIDEIEFTRIARGSFSMAFVSTQSKSQSWHRHFSSTPCTLTAHGTDVRWTFLDSFSKLVLWKVLLTILTLYRSTRTLCMNVLKLCSRDLWLWLAFSCRAWFVWT